MREIALAPWRVCAIQPYQQLYNPFIAEGKMIPMTTEWMDAEVPGSVYRDLLRAGLIEDPYYAENSLRCEWVANRWWAYRTTFTCAAEELGKALILRFEEIDYKAHVYINGVHVATQEGMYIPLEIDIAPQVHAGENTLVCVLESAPVCDPQGGYTSRTRYLKARFNYKWDFVTRLVNVGLSGAVTLRVCEAARIVHAFVRPVKEGTQWRLECEAEVTAAVEAAGALEVRAQIVRESDAREVTAATEARLVPGLNRIRVMAAVPGEPALWWPNGYGAQALHSVTLTLLMSRQAVDRRNYRIGFRTLEYRHAEGRADALRYQVVINGKPIYLKGTNVVPFDCMSGIPAQRLAAQLAAIRDANVNFLRIWGGGHIESEAYYRLCDEMGLMIMQEFPMSSSGVDDVPSRDPQFLQLLERCARETGKVKRNHVSLTFFDGGNELTDIRFQGRPDHEAHPATFEDPTLAMLKGILNEVCPDVQMLPSSGSGPNALLQKGDTGNNHDVHGPWGYAGVKKHYALYNESDSIVHGEFGCGGMANMSTLEKILPPADRHVTTAFENRIWAHHSGGWDSYNGRERVMFGDLTDLPLAEYGKVSQFVQAEALRYALEANRRREWKNVGEMTWQFNEPWPNVQCSNVLDYFGGKKLAYYFIQEAYAPVLASLRYDQLFFTAGEAFHAQVYLLSDRAPDDYRVHVQVLTSDGKVLYDDVLTGHIPEDVSRRIAELTLTLPAGITGSFSVRMTVECAGFHADKEYLFLIADRRLPLFQSRQDVQMESVFPNRHPDADIHDDLRADWRCVASFVDRMKARYE